MESSSPDHILSAYDYVLPPSAIAQAPMVPRDRSRLLQVDSQRQRSHHIFRELPDLLRSGDLLIFNDTKVMPARLYGQKPSGTPIEVLLLEPVAPDRWLALVKPGKRLPVGSSIHFQAGVTAEVCTIDEPTRGRILQFTLPPGQTFAEVMAKQGVMPLPPYITQPIATPEQYQTIYAKNLGAVAAPTAGLHFTEELLDRLTEKGIAQAWITLHVGVGTFRPVEVEDITQHEMHEEWCAVSPQVIAAIDHTRSQGGRVIGVGTTVARAIESSQGQPFCGKTNLMIYPGYQWQILEGLITNFHLPRSSLMMLVASFLGEQGREFLLETYAHAIEENYRFYSFGDSTLLWRGNR